MNQHRSETCSDAPLVIFARAGNALRLVAGDACAARAGLSAGVTLADARARYPALVAVEQDAGADRGWLEGLARHCLDYAPLVALAPPDGITIDITGAGHLFGGEAALAETLESQMNEAGIAPRLAIAGSAGGALALARYGAKGVDESAAIAALPVAALGLDHAGTRGLERAGLKRLGDVAARPAAGIAARFGAEAVAALRDITGEAATPPVPLALRQSLRFEQRFAEPVTQQAAIAQALLALMHEAAAALAERGLGGRRFRLTLHRSDGATQRLAIDTGAATRDPALVLRLFDERIAGLADPLDPGFGYDSMVLAVPATEPLGAVQAGFDGETAGETALAELIDRLSTRLGAGAVRRLVPQDSHIPEQAQLALPAITCPKPARWPPPIPGEPPLRPLLLFDPPQRVEVVAEVPDGPPHRFRWRRRLHEVRLFEGPERIAGEWWRVKGGETAGKGGLTRDYYRVEDARGRRFWLFRHGLYAEKPDPRWYLHGLFA